MSVAAAAPPELRNSFATASRCDESRSASGFPASRARRSSASRTSLVSRPSVARMSAWIFGSSAPGTLYSSLSGIIIAAIMRRSSRWTWVRTGSINIASSVKEIGEAALHLIGDVERDGLNGGGRVHPARSDENAAVDDEEVLHVVRPAPFIHDRALGISPHPCGAEQMPAAVEDWTVDADVGGAGGGEHLFGARDAMFHH